MTPHTRRAVALLAATLFGAATACSAGTDAAPGPAASPAAEKPPPEGFTLVASGDLLVHDSVIRQAAADADGAGYDFGPMLAGVRSLASGADLAICHMETVYGPEEGPFTGYPMFHTPPQLAAAVGDLGYDSCSTASNHTLDAGVEGVRRTLDAMDAAGLKHAGSARSAKERETPTLLRAGDAKVAHLAYAYGTNGIPVPEDTPWLVNLIDPERIVEDARAARRAGADVVVVSVHWGTEWQEAPDELQLSLADRLTASALDGRRDIDLIIGTHAHVPQAYEKVNGTWVVYGMGDQVAGVMTDPRGQLGSAARFTFAPPREQGGPWTVRKAEFVPFAVRNDPIAVVNLPEALATDPGDAALADSLEQVKSAVLGRGAAEDGLRMGS
ncbi:CapA family protein [Streptomyces hoynatensis]|uniref:CapA family protein n=1 Tax=Streptomyces hoynatensis TaxID=1141874 RepID=A0A3A9YZ92_9ACTN|nr:CapA family protein [Streptomyces hoynatensis]RKN41190.1 CapA family protein [Streptomyces hoynatensis]